MNTWLGVRLEVTSAPTALAFTASMKVLTTGRATSASSSAMRTSRRASRDVVFGDAAASRAGYRWCGASRAVRLSNMGGHYRVTPAYCHGPRGVNIEDAPLERRSFDASCCSRLLRAAARDRLLLGHRSGDAVGQPLPHRATGRRSGQRSARVLERLLQKPDDWLGANLVILAAASVFASAVATILAQRTGHPYAVPVDGRRAHRGDDRVLRARCPRSMRPRILSRVAFSSRYVYRALVAVARPAAVGHEQAGVRLPAPLRRQPKSSRAEQTLSTEELRTVVAEAGPLIPAASPADAAVDPRSRAGDGQRHHDPAAGDRRRSTSTRTGKTCSTSCGRRRTRACPCTRASSTTSSACCT